MRVTPTLPAESNTRIHWQVDGVDHQAQWRSERQQPPPREIRVVDDRLPADLAFRLARAETGLLWSGDYQNARHLLQAMARRADRPPRPGADLRQGRDSGHQSLNPAGRSVAGREDRVDPAEAKGDASAAAARFHHHRDSQARRAQILARVLIALQPDRSIALRRAPDVRQACLEAWGPPDGEGSVVALTELLGVFSAHEWRRRGVEISSLGPAPNNRIHPHYGVYSPVRGEYIDLVRRAPLPAGAQDLAMDIGTGTGVLAALLARRGVRRVLATDADPRALACARDNLNRLGLADRVTVLDADLFPPEPCPRAALVVCNPPWLPAVAGSSIERAVYDEDSRMLRGFLSRLPQALLPGGEGWLILSDLAEHLGLRSRESLWRWMTDAGLVVVGRLETRPRHPKASDTRDALHRARAAEVTSLWRLRVAA
jgi:SAM-dependent methyltransferase